MNPIYKIKEGVNHQTVFQPGEDGIKWLGLDILRLAAGEQWQGSFENEEAALIILSGQCDVDLAEHSWQKLGGRVDTFAGTPTLVYVPRNTKFTVTAGSTLEMAITKTHCSVDLPPALIKSEDIKIVNAGIESWRRDVRMLIPPGSPITQRLIIGETINPPGKWSGVTPHRHDRINENENILEEFYLFKMKPADGFGIQLIYGHPDGEKQSYMVHENDVAVMLNGFHPTVAPPGVTVAYLWVISGDDKAYKVSGDPRFAWISGAEATIKEMKRD